MDEDARLARQRPEPTRIHSEAGPTGLGDEHEWTQGQLPYDSFTFSLRVKPDRRRSAMPVDSASERRRR